MIKTRLFSLISRLCAAAAFLTFLPGTARAEVENLAKPWQIGLSQPGSPVMEQIVGFHNTLLYIITGIVIFVMLLLLYVMIRFNKKANPVPSQTTHNVALEVVWTLVPVLILAMVVIPSMRLLFFVDRIEEADMTLKVRGFQWYWAYEYPDNDGIAFDAIMVAEEDLKEGQHRLLDTYNPVVLPTDTNIRVLITAEDVLHSWAVPALGVKKDAVPGQTNETWIRIEKPGKYYGQCSELCGEGHGFMPITILAVTPEEFKAWTEKAKLEFGSVNDNNNNAVEFAMEFPQTAGGK
ncbi:MAG: cytochrome c oxidase subunit II [Pseudomonadota bacterium]|mgnify:CR=1 FL=1|nr:cytochrome c oxidase subunit II [Pseudomonadota bacterium]QKK04199.1 MAG: cytochrome c oxidase subunit II [Pseudomonadota bacterium]